MLFLLQNLKPLEFIYKILNLQSVKPIMTIFYPPISILRESKSQMDSVWHA